MQDIQICNSVAKNLVWSQLLHKQEVILESTKALAFKQMIVQYKFSYNSKRKSTLF